MASGQPTYNEKVAAQAERERRAKVKALKTAEDADVLQRIRSARSRANNVTTMDTARIQERFVGRVVSSISKDFNGLLKARRIKAAGKDAVNWKRGTFAARAQVTVAQRANDKQELKAWTDFTTAFCQVNGTMVPRFNQRQDVKKWIARIRGAMFHEVGHMQWSIPARTMMDRANFTLDDVKAIQPNLKLITEKMAANSWKGTTVVDHAIFSEFHKPWNVLEDQRMETTVVRNYPYAPQYLTPLILKLMVLDSSQPETCWMLIGGRKYLPVQVRDAARDKFNQWFTTQEQTVQDLLHTDDTITPADQWLDIVDSYKAATTCTEMFVNVCAAQLWLENLNLGDMGQDDTHNDMQWSELPADETARREKSGATSGGQEVTNVQPEGDGDDGEGEDDTEVTNTKASNGKAEHGTFNTLHEIAQGAIDGAIGDLPPETTIGDALRDANSDKLLPFDREIKDLPSAWVDKSFAVSVGIERALQAFVTANEPIWRGRQNSGVLDALAYRTRETGATDYRRFLDDDGREGMDVHVTMLCDNSGSMGSNMGALSAALLAMSTACERVGAGYDIVLWSTEYFRLDAATEPILYPSLGGTEIVPALKDLENSPVGEHVKNHLVLIFTDGAWYDSVKLTDWQNTGSDAKRTFVLAKYGYAGSSDYGADKVVQLDDIMDFPQLLETGLRELSSVRR